MTAPTSPTYVRVTALVNLPGLAVGESTVVPDDARLAAKIAQGYLERYETPTSDLPIRSQLPVSYADVRAMFDALVGPYGTDDLQDRSVTLAKLAEEVTARLGGGGSATTDASALTSGQLSINRLSAILAAANGLAGLDGNAQVPLSQLPSSVKDRAPLRQGVRSTNGTALAPALADANGTVIETVATTAVTFTVPPAATVAWTVGDTIDLVQLAAGQVTITAGSGVTLQSRGAALKTAGQFAAVSLRYRGSDTWLVVGDVVA